MPRPRTTPKRRPARLLRASDPVAGGSTPSRSSPTGSSAPTRPWPWPTGLAAARVDLVVIANVAFPNGQVFLTLATHPHLAQTPLAVIAEPEPESPEWATNAWCGVIMNNHVARQLGRPIVTLPGPFAGEAFPGRIRPAAARGGDDPLPAPRLSLPVRRRPRRVPFGHGRPTRLRQGLRHARRYGGPDRRDGGLPHRQGPGYLGEAAFSDDDVRQTVSPDHRRPRGASRCRP